MLQLDFLKHFSNPWTPLRMFGVFQIASIWMWFWYLKHQYFCIKKSFFFTNMVKKWRKKQVENAISRLVALASNGCVITRKDADSKFIHILVAPFFGPLFAPLFCENALFFAPFISSFAPFWNEAAMGLGKASKKKRWIFDRGHTYPGPPPYLWPP